MKKSLLVIAVAGLALASCKKDYTCTCIYTPSGSTTPQTQVYQMKKVKKSEAQYDCNSLGQSWINFGGTCDFK